MLIFIKFIIALPFLILGAVYKMSFLIYAILGVPLLLILFVLAPEQNEKELHRLLTLLYPDFVGSMKEQFGQKPSQFYNQIIEIIRLILVGVLE